MHQKLKNWIVFTFLFMSVGILAELVLLTHYEDTWQLIPIVIVLILVALVIASVSTSGKLLNKSLRAVLILCALSGLLGIYFHLNANWEFESEMHPGQSLKTTLIDSLSGALPALAPASMLVLSLLGYIYLLTKHENN